MFTIFVVTKIKSRGLNQLVLPVECSMKKNILGNQEPATYLKATEKEIEEV